MWVLVMTPVSAITAAHGAAWCQWPPVACARPSGDAEVLARFLAAIEAGID
jgi:hypothetical protein